MDLTKEASIRKEISKLKNIVEEEILVGEEKKIVRFYCHRGHMPLEPMPWHIYHLPNIKFGRAFRRYSEKIGDWYVLDLKQFPLSRYITGFSNSNIGDCWEFDPDNLIFKYKFSTFGFGHSSLEKVKEMYFTTKFENPIYMDCYGNIHDDIEYIDPEYDFDDERFDNIIKYFLTYKGFVLAECDANRTVGSHPGIQLESPIVNFKFQYYQATYGKKYLTNRVNHSFHNSELIQHLRCCIFFWALQDGTINSIESIFIHHLTTMKL